MRTFTRNRPARQVSRDASYTTARFHDGEGWRASLVREGRTQLHLVFITDTGLVHRTVDQAQARHWLAPLSYHGAPYPVVRMVRKFRDIGRARGITRAAMNEIGRAAGGGDQTKGYRGSLFKSEKQNANGLAISNLPAAAPSAVGSSKARMRREQTRLRVRRHRAKHVTHPPQDGGSVTNRPPRPPAQPTAGHLRPTQPPPAVCTPGGWHR